MDPAHSLMSRSLLQAVVGAVLLSFYIPSAVANPGIPPFSFPDCSLPPLNTNAVCDTSKNATERATALVELLTLTEMINATGISAGPFPNAGLPFYEWENEALHGLAISPGVTFNASGEYSYATSFPSPILTGAAFDDALVLQVGTVISTEARAYNNVGQAGLNYFTPNINPFRDPRWGRGQETPGEDPYHIAQYVYNIVEGLQGGIDPTYLKVVADCKHAAGYDIEDWEGNLRYGYNAVISTQDLSEYYLPSFQSCVRDAKVGSVMCSYNAVNGIPTCANEYLLQDIIRDYWGFDETKYIVSDCDAVANIYDAHHYTDDYTHAAAVAINAGTDINCGGSLTDPQSTSQAYLGQAINESLVTVDTLKRSLVRTYASQVRLGYFDSARSQPYRRLGWSDVNTPSAQQLAYDAAAEGIVLLKNDGTLPFKKTIRKIALIGPWANATTQMQGNYNGIAPYLISPLLGATRAGYEVSYVFGTNISDTSTDGFAAAIAAAQGADAIVYAGGIDNTVEAEAMDRMDISWPGNQLQLISELGALSKPLVVLQFGGGQLDDTVLKNSSSVNAIVWGGYPGQSGGQAVFDVVSGKVAPAGRLPVTQYPSDYISVPMTDMTVRPSSTSPGRTYKWYTGQPVYEFGHGLHYTSFAFQWLARPAPVYSIAQIIAAGHRSGASFLDLAPFTTFSASVVNTGRVTSDYVALLFVSTTGGPQPLPNKWLAKYTRLHDVAPGRRVTASLPVTIGSISRTDENGNQWVYPGKYTVTLDTPALLTAEFELTGPAVQITYWPVDNTNQS